MNDNFKLNSNRTKLGITLMTIAIILFLVSIFVLVKGVVIEIQDKGLKNIIEEIWEGPDE